MVTVNLSKGFGMQKHVIGSLLVAGLCLAIGFGGQRGRDVDRALKQEYPDAQTEITGRRVLNGVKVFDVKIRDRHGESTATVTEFGDFILTGQPRGDWNISRPALETLNGLFKGGQRDVDVYHATNYLIDVWTDHKLFRLRFDPVGRLNDVDNEAEIHKDDVQNLQRVNRDAHSLHADDYARKYYSDCKIEGIYRAPNLDDFFIVEMRQADGYDARITLNNDGRVFSEREQIDVHEIPKPIFDAIDQMFDRTKIDRAYRYDYEYYQFDKVTNAGDHVSVRIRPNGDVLGVTNEEIDRQDEVRRHDTR
jgi:hypothetical protein